MIVEPKKEDLIINLHRWVWNPNVGAIRVVTRRDPTDLITIHTGRIYGERLTSSYKGGKAAQL